VLLKISNSGPYNFPYIKGAFFSVFKKGFSHSPQGLNLGIGFRRVGPNKSSGLREKEPFLMPI